MKFFYVLLFFLFFRISLFCNNIIIGIAEPFIHNSSSATLFIKSNFIFELYTGLSRNDIQFYSLQDNATNLEFYIIKNSEVARENNLDYLLLIEAHSFKDKLFLNLKFINPHNNEIIFISNHVINFDIKINEKIEIIANMIIKKIEAIELLKNTTKSISFDNQIKEKKQNTYVSDILLVLSNYPKNEFFILNSFGKSNSDFFSLLSIYTGYSRYISEGFFTDIGFTAGIGEETQTFKIVNTFRNYYIGAFVGLHFYIKGFIEPNFGARAEIVYTDTNKLNISIPIELGLKLLANKNNVLRISVSFPFNTYDIFSNKLSKKMTLGLMVGYGFKI